MRQSTDSAFESCIKIGVEGVMKDASGRNLPPTSLKLAFSAKEEYNYFMDGVFGPGSS